MLYLYFTVPNFTITNILEEQCHKVLSEFARYRNSIHDQNVDYRKWSNNVNITTQAENESNQHPEAPTGFKDAHLYSRI
jgi:hypothetical protein